MCNIQSPIFVNDNRKLSKEVEPAVGYWNYTSDVEKSEEELRRKITSAKEVAYLNKKDGAHSWRIGRSTLKFNSIKQIHSELIRRFPDQTIVTYYDKGLFKEMLVYINGQDHGVEYFGEQWKSVPISCYKDLVPLDKVKIKCESCDHEYTLDEVVKERVFNDRPWIKFLRGHEMKEGARCCRDFDLIWNVIL